MKVDKDLMREILLAVEANDHETLVLDLPRYSLQELSFHVRLLHESGFFKELSSFDGHVWRPTPVLTYLGHEFVDAIRDPETWNMVKEESE